MSNSLRYTKGIFAMLALMAGAAVFGLVAYAMGSEQHTQPLLLVNLFWLGFNALSLLRVLAAAFWRPRLPDGSLLSQPA